MILAHSAEASSEPGTPGLRSKGLPEDEAQTLTTAGLTTRVNQILSTEDLPERVGQALKLGPPGIAKSGQKESICTLYILYSNRGNFPLNFIRHCYPQKDSFKGTVQRDLRGVKSGINR